MTSIADVEASQKEGSFASGRFDNIQDPEGKMISAETKRNFSYVIISQRREETINFGCLNFQDNEEVVVGIVGRCRGLNVRSGSAQLRSGFSIKASER